MSERKAVVIGALGVIGRYIVEQLLAQGSWQVLGVSRRAAAEQDNYRHLSVDLLDADATERAFASISDVTHVFYAAFQASVGAAANYAANIAPNRDMLVHAVTAIARHSRALQRVVLVTGTKYYGIHLGPLKTPMRETDPRHMPPDYYFDQIDWLTEFQRGELQRGKLWTWAELRPQTLCGFAPGTAMSILPAIAAYASVSKALGLPLRFPGKAGAYRSIYQVCESAQMARAALWAATEPRCANEAFNITNGDYFRWQHMWPLIADVFEMPVGDPQMISLTAHMADKAPLWHALQRQHGLVAIGWEQLAAWPYADYVFASEWDIMSDVTKSRLFGFHDVVDSQEMFVRLLQRFRDQKIVP
jgi:nucleoside-diphosphate-sugar epimerase